LKEIKIENFNISENNIISVEPAKVPPYTLNFHPQKVGFRVILSLPWPHAIHLMGGEVVLFLFWDLCRWVTLMLRGPAS
jgi:hypothetical protein